MSFYVDRLARSLLLLISLLLWTSPATADPGFTWVLEPQFEDAGAPMDGVVPLKTGGLWGLMGRDGAWVVPPSFNAMGAQSDGLFTASSKGKWGVVDAQGQVRIEFVHDAIGTPGYLTPVYKTGGWYIIDNAGEYYPLQIDRLIDNEGYCIVGEREGRIVSIWRGPQPNEAIASNSGIVSFNKLSDGEISVELADGSQTITSCRLVIDEFRYDQVESPEAFGASNDGWIAAKRGERWGFESTDSSGGMKYIDGAFVSVRAFSEGLAPVQVDGGKWGYIDEEGEMVIEPRFSDAYGFSGGIAGVRISEKRGFINTDGEYVIEPQFDDFWRHDSGITPVKEGGFWGLISVNGKEPEHLYALDLSAAESKLNNEPPLLVLSSLTDVYYSQDIMQRFEISERPDGRAFMTLLRANFSDGGGGRISVWDRITGQLIAKLEVPGGTSASFLPNVRIVAVGTLHGDLVFYDTVTGGEILRHQILPGSVDKVSLSPDGLSLAAVGGGWLRIWSMPDGKLRASKRALESHLAFAKDSQSIWLADYGGFLRKVGIDGATIFEDKRNLRKEQSDALWGSVPMGGESSFYFHGMLSGDGVFVRMSGGEDYSTDKNGEDYSTDGNTDEDQPAIREADEEFCRRTVYDYQLHISTVEGRKVVAVPSVHSQAISLDLSHSSSEVAIGSQIFQLGSKNLESNLAIMAPVSDCRPEENYRWEGLDVTIGNRQVQTSWIDSVKFLADGSLVLVTGGGYELVEVSSDRHASLRLYGSALTLYPEVAILNTKPESVFIWANNSQWQEWSFEIGSIVNVIEMNGLDAPEPIGFTDGREIFIWDWTKSSGMGLEPESGVIREISADEYDSLLNEGNLTNDRIGAQVALSPDQRLAVSDYERKHGPAAPVPLVSGDSRMLFVPSDESSFAVIESKTEDLLGTLYVSRDGNWLFLTPEGFFNASKDGGSLISISNGLQAWSADQVYQALYRPDLVTAKLAGDPDGNVASAAAKLDLEVVFSSGPPPALRMISPMRNVETTERAINFSVLVEDAGGGVGKLEWRVNGVTQRITKVDGGGVARARIALLDGENEVEVVAYNKAGLIASVPVSTKVVRQGTVAAENPILHVLAVGVNEYSDGRIRLAYAAPDARAFSDAMGLAAKGLLGADPSVNVILDAEATDESIDAAFSRLSSVVKPADVFVLFVAGHGKTIEGRYHFLPADFRFDGEGAVERNGISQDRWQDWLSRVPAQKSVLIFDTCESGAMTAARSVEDALRQSAAIDRLTRAVGRTVFSATSGEDDAYEGFRGHGVMTYALLEGLNDGDADKNGTVEVTELASYLDRRVPEISYSAFGLSQVPQMSISGSDFSIARTGLVSSIALMEDEEENDQNEKFPDKVTHVVLGRTEVLDAPGGQILDVIESEGVVGVYLILEEGSFARIARDGSELGWVRTSAIKRVQ